MLLFIKHLLNATDDEQEWFHVMHGYQKMQKKISEEASNMSIFLQGMMGYISGSNKTISDEQKSNIKKIFEMIFDPAQSCFQQNILRFLFALKIKFKDLSPESAIVLLDYLPVFIQKRETYLCLWDKGCMSNLFEKSLLSPHEEIRNTLQKILLGF